jgi:hypothetical protein
MEFANGNICKKNIAKKRKKRKKKKKTQTQQLVQHMIDKGVEIRQAFDNTGSSPPLSFALHTTSMCYKSSSELVKSVTGGGGGGGVRRTCLSSSSPSDELLLLLNTSAARRRYCGVDVVFCSAAVGGTTRGGTGASLGKRWATTVWLGGTAAEPLRVDVGANPLEICCVSETAAAAAVAVAVAVAVVVRDDSGAVGVL